MQNKISDNQATKNISTRQAISNRQQFSVRKNNLKILKKQRNKKVCPEWLEIDIMKL